MNRLVVISGCSGGGKTTLLSELVQRGYEVVEEPGRRIIAEQVARGGDALPWSDVQEFANRAIQMSLADIDRVSHVSGWVFLDRGLIDAAAALSHHTGEHISHYLGARRNYHDLVFLTPPWPEIYVTDSDRRHLLTDAIEEYERLLQVYPSLGYKVTILPKTSVVARADFVLDLLER